MNILIQKEQTEDEEFVRYLIKLIPIILSSRLSAGKILSFDKKVDSLGLYENKFDSRYILTASSKTMTYKKDVDGYRISVKPNFLVIRYGQNLDTLCDFVTYGNTQISGYPIFLEIEKDIITNLSKYIGYYKTSIL